MRINDKLVLLLLICLCSAALSESALPVVISLAVLIAAMLTEFFTDKRLIFAVQAAFMAACFFVPAACIGLPMTAYDIMRYRSKKMGIFCLITMAAAYLNVSGRTAALSAVGVVLAVYLEICTDRHERTEKKLREVRDNSAELNLLLGEKNRSLIKLRDSEVYSATLRERNRIAREIHDNVGHMLTRCLLQIGALSVITKDDLTREKLGDIQETLNNAMTSIRRSVHDLHDDSIDLRSAVNDIVSDAKERFSVSLDYDVSETVSGEIKLAFIGILKEAVNNAVKYSSGDTLRVSVQEYPGFCRLSVSDNGTEKKSDSGGIGIENMRERATALGGSFTAEMTDKGFRVFASIPK